MYKRSLITPLLILALTRLATAQTPILNTPITFECRQQPLGHVLERISTTGGFYFSYSGTLFNKDSLVTLPAQTRSVRQLLDLLFHGRLQYLEDGRYLILLPAANKPTQLAPEDSRYLVSGTILDRRTGGPLLDASVYDPAELSATMSKKDGSFTVRVKNKGMPIVLAVSKENYIDTIIQLPPGSSRDLTISISPDAFPPKAPLFSGYPYSTNRSIHTDYAIDTTGKDLVPAVEATGFGRILLSYRLRMQSLNLKKVFVQRPVQLSLVPGLSTNGPLNSQVTNKFSINLIGGYSAGLTGVELGGVFNIDKKSVTGLQAAGVVNIVGGAVHGVQLAGIVNKDLDSVTGFQAAGIANIAKTIKGMQLSVFNYADSVKGVQYGYLNHTHHLKGVQVGLINFADTSEGVSIGPINIIKHGGLHELSFYADELSPLNLGYRLGTPKFYGIVYAGMNPSEQHRSYYYGFGYGTMLTVSHNLGIRPELTFGQLAPLTLRHLDHTNALARFNIDLHWQAAKKLAISAGPSINFYYIDNYYYLGGRSYQPLPYGYHTFPLKDKTSVGWIGWHVAINLF